MASFLPQSPARKLIVPYPTETLKNNQPPINNLPLVPVLAGYYWGDRHLLGVSM